MAIIHILLLRLCSHGQILFYDALSVLRDLYGAFSAHKFPCSCYGYGDLSQQGSFWSLLALLGKTRLLYILFVHVHHQQIGPR